MKTVDAGKLGEQIAERALRRDGMKTLERNYRIGHLEIDRIMWEHKTGTLVFVEVKARSDSSRTFPREAVTAQKQWRLRQAAQMYCNRNGFVDTPCRFDVVEVWLDSKHVERIENAF